MTDQLTLSDLVLLKDASSALEAAQVTFKFVDAHMGRAYNFKPGDQLDLITGIITRGAPAPANVAPLQLAADPAPDAAVAPEPDKQ